MHEQPERQSQKLDGVPPGYRATALPAAATAAASAESLARCHASSLPKPSRGTPRVKFGSRVTSTTGGATAAGAAAQGSASSGSAANRPITWATSATPRAPAAAASARADPTYPRAPIPQICQKTAPATSGAGFLLAQRKGWRPSEVCRLAPSDISLPGDGWTSAVVRLGVGRGTKSRREELSLFGADEILELELLRRLKVAGAS